MKKKGGILFLAMLVFGIALMTCGVFAISNMSAHITGSIGVDSTTCDVYMYGTVTGALKSFSDSGTTTFYLGKEDNKIRLKNSAHITLAKYLTTSDNEPQPTIYFNGRTGTAQPIVVTLNFENAASYKIKITVNEQLTGSENFTITRTQDLTSLDASGKGTMILTLNPTSAVTSSQQLSDTLDILIEVVDAYKPTSAKYFTFSESSVTGYNGPANGPDNNGEIIIPRSYDKDAEGNIIDGSTYKVVTVQGSSSTGGICKDFAGSVVLLDNITHVGNYAFKDCSLITKITIPASVKTWSSFPTFSNCNLLKEVYFNGSLNDWCSMKFSYGCNPCCNGATLYINNEPLTEVNFEGVTELLGDYTFNGCTSIETVVIPDWITSISMGCFRECTSLTQITISDKVTEFGNVAFMDCTALRDVYYKGTLQQWCNINFIGYDGGNPCRNRATLYIGNKPVTEVNFENVSEVKPAVFFGCTSLLKVTIPEGITSIGTNAFYDCTSLSQITITDNVIEFGNGAFGGCSALHDVYYQGTLQQWCNINFECSNGQNSNPCCGKATLYINNEPVTEANFEGVTEVKPNVFHGCISLQKVTIPEGITSIGEYAFEYCSSLQTVKINAGVTEIGKFAFENCTSLSEIILPSSVTTIGNYAFDICNKLSKIYFIGTKAEFASLLENGVGTRNQEFTSATVYYKIENESSAPSEPGLYWYYNSDGSIAELEVEEQFTVKFKLDATTSSVYRTQSVKSGQCATLPTTPSKDYYTFEGWTLNGNDVVDVTEYVINEETTFIAKFRKDKLVVTFTSSGWVIETQGIDLNGGYATPPTYISLTFNGWSIDGATIIDVASYKITEDTKFIAVHGDLETIKEEMTYGYGGAGKTVINTYVNGLKVGDRFKISVLNFVIKPSSGGLNYEGGYIFVGSGGNSPGSYEWSENDGSAGNTFFSELTLYSNDPYTINLGYVSDYVYNEVTITIKCVEDGVLTIELSDQANFYIDDVRFYHVQVVR